VKFSSIIYLFIFLIIASSCSQSSNSPTSKAWHNLNAKYNALLLAREDYKYALNYIQQNNKENYETVLPIFLKIDSTKLDSAKLLLIDAVKKTSLIAERHSNSRHLDEAYLILGKARLYKQELYNAIETFKYVNTKSTSNTAKNEALIWLMRSYIDNSDLATANQVADMLKTEKLSKNKKSTFFITKAYFHQVQKEEALAVVFLEEGLKNYPKGKQKARLHFIAGQLYDKLNKPVLARKNYNSVLKNKPFYDLEFNTKLGLMMNQSLAKNTNNDFEKLINDRKNQDLLDKIYFKMGEMEAKKNNFKNAIVNYSKSVANANENQLQKAFSYKAIGDIYFDNLNDFETAAIYYDSTLITIPKDFEDYKNISQRALSLNNFIRYKKVLDLEDSLQHLAGMNPVELDYKLDKILEEKAKNQKKAEENSLLASASAAEAASNSQIKTGIGQKIWLFYDKLEYAKSKNEFVRIWGNRQLEDNWRRSEKETGSFSIKIERTKIDTASTAKAQDSLDEKEQQEKIELEQDKADLLKKIPKSQIQMMASKRKQEEAYFQLGKIYKLQFQDDPKAKKMFTALINDFVNSVYEPEALYFMALMEPKSDVPNSYETQLLKKHPYSSFTRLVKKGNVKLTKDSETEVQTLYANSFKLYQEQKFTESLAILDKILNEFGGSQIEDKVALLRIYILAKFDNQDQYMISLNDFLRSYPTSDLTIKAKQMLTAINK
jgi:outer membrane protein assembly factor BamD (BamD/ComL family)